MVARNAKTASTESPGWVNPRDCIRRQRGLKKRAQPLPGGRRRARVAVERTAEVHLTRAGRVATPPVDPVVERYVGFEEPMPRLRIDVRRIAEGVLMCMQVLHRERRERRCRPHGIRFSPEKQDRAVDALEGDERRTGRPGGRQRLTVRRDGWSMLAIGLPVEPSG